MNDPHKQGRVSRDHYYRKTEFRGRLFAILDWQVEDRGLTIMPHISRAVRSGDILELITTDETGKKAGDGVDRIATIGFAEVAEAGLLLSGDVISIAKSEIGHIVGFDETHMPNHLNVIVEVASRKTGRAFDFDLDAVVTIAGIDPEEHEKLLGF